MKNAITMLLAFAMAVLCLCACEQEPKSCSHQWENGVCSLCQEICAHNRYAEGKCKRCGESHKDHSWWNESARDGSTINDVCEICAYKCLHVELDENHTCAECAKVILHRYSDETHTCIAPDCGAQSQYFYEGLPAGYTEESGEPGTLVELTYTTPMYVAEQVDGTYADKTVEKLLYVYLPYGYDAQKQYNVLYLIHGSGGESATWLVQQKQTKNVVDNLISNGDCEPCIIVTPSYYYGDTKLDLQLQDSFPLYFYQELRNEIIPLVESTYLTYANGDVTEAGLAGSRDHRAMAGFSRGSRTTLNSGVLNCVDLISYFGCFNAISADGKEVNDVLSSEKFEQYDINFMYNGVSRCDYTRSYHTESYYSILEHCDKLVEGKNTVLVDKYGFEHDADNATLDLFNFMMFDLFKHTEE